MGVQCLGATLAPLRTRALGSKSDAGDRARGRVRRAPRVALVPRAALAGVARVHAHRARAVTRGRTPRHVPSAASGDAPAPEDAREPANDVAGSIDGVADALDVIARDIGGGSSSSSGKVLLVALVALVSIHVRDPGWGVWNVIRVVGSLVLGAGLAFKGYRGGSLDRSGAVGAALVGWGTLYAGVRFGVVLGAFFFLSSAMTRVGGEIKRRIDENHVPGAASGARNWIQVAANGLVPTFLAMSYSFATGGPEYLLGVNNAFETPLAAAFIGYYGCCCGDTWSSELGVLSKKMPRLITTGEQVKPGTNGGVTTLGLAASAAGGFAVGFAFWIGGLFVPVVTGKIGLALQFAAQWPVLVIGLGAGVVGSLMDSLLGATIQFSGYCSERRRMVSKPGPTVTKVSGLNFLSNSAVNFVTASLCALILYYGTIFAGIPR
mmetsp:Transcript_5183/g.19485  ORF Transcript_5183/g.19485 Transcript_5183/m.19485 type:complete len:435 (-) Transcript_5183:215-1519(-)